MSNHGAGLFLPTEPPSSLCTTSTYSDPFETNYEHHDVKPFGKTFSHEPLDDITIPQHCDYNNVTNCCSSLHYQHLVSPTPGLVEPTEHLKPNHISVRSHNMSRQSFSKPSPIDPIYTESSPSLSRFMRPNYNTFSQDSQNPKVDQVNSLCEYVPGKIISTHFYERPTSRKHNSSYNTSNNSSYAHANIGASRHTSRTHTQTQQPRNNVHVNTHTQPNTVPHVMNSAPYNPSNIPITQGAHTLPYPTRRRSCCWCFCCIYLLIMLIVVLPISVVVVVVYIHYL